MKEERRMRTFYRAAGLFGVALLTLSACEPAGETGTDDPGQEGVDPDGADDQGNPPEEIADDEDEGEDREEDDADDQAAEDSAEVPDLDEIEDQIWESSTGQESVTITGEISPALLGWEDLGAAAEDEEESEEDLDPVAARGL